MSTNFPTNKDVFTNPTATDKVSVLSHADQHADANDAIEALQDKVGIDNSIDNTTHDFKLQNVADGDKAVSVQGAETLTNKTLTSPTITSPTGIVKADVGLSNVTNDAQVALTGNQTIAGVKTFSSSPIIPDPLNPQEPVTRAYFEANSGGAVVEYIAGRSANTNTSNNTYYINLNDNTYRPFGYSDATSNIVDIVVPTDRTINLMYFKILTVPVTATGEISVIKNGTIAATFTVDPNVTTFQSQVVSVPLVAGDKLAFGLKTITGQFAPFSAGFIATV